MTKLRLAFNDYQNDSALGIDIGRVLMCPAADDGSPDTSFLTGSVEEALATPAAPGMWEVVPRLVTLFGGRVWLVSKCGSRISQLTAQWLAHHRFFERTGISSANLRFCRKRPEKAQIAAQLGLTHFIDDRIDVLAAMGTVGNRVLFGTQTEAIPTWAIHLPAWSDLGETLGR